MKTWVKLYTEINRDPEMASLTWAERGIWSALLALAGEIDVRDELGGETGALDTVENVAWHLRCDETEMEIALAAFKVRGMVTTRDGIVYIVHYGERQARPPSSRPEAVAQRVREHRERERGNEDVTRVKRGVTPSDKKREETEEMREDTDSERAERAVSLAGSSIFSFTASPTEQSETLDAFIDNISAELKDGGHAQSNRTQARNIWPPGMSEEEVLHWARRAAEVTRKHILRGRVEGAPMPYFFGVLKRGIQAIKVQT